MRPDTGGAIPAAHVQKSRMAAGGVGPVISTCVHSTETAPVDGVT